MKPALPSPLASIFGFSLSIKLGFLPVASCPVSPCVLCVAWVPVLPNLPCWLWLPSSVKLVVPSAPLPPKGLPPNASTCLGSPAKESTRSSRPLTFPPFLWNSSIVTAGSCVVVWCLASFLCTSWTGTVVWTTLGWIVSFWITGWMFSWTWWWTCSPTTAPAEPCVWCTSPTSRVFLNCDFSCSNFDATREESPWLISRCSTPATRCLCSSGRTSFCAIGWTEVWWWSWWISRSMAVWASSCCVRWTFSLVTAELTLYVWLVYLVGKVWKRSYFVDGGIVLSVLVKKAGNCLLRLVHYRGLRWIGRTLNTRIVE